MEEATQFEDPAHLHAIFQGTGAVAEGAPQEWVDGLKIHATKVRRIALAWRRGSAPYVPIPGAVVELPEILKKDGTVVDERSTDATKWATENAKQRWAVAVEWAKKNGPVIDVQLQLWGYDKKKGVFSIIKGTAIAKRVNLTGEGAAWMDDGQTTERVMFALVDKLTTSLDKRDEKYIQLSDSIAKHYGNIGTLVSGVLQSFQVAMQMREQSAGAHASVHQANQNFMVQLARIRATEQGVNNAVSQLGPTIREVFSGWGPSREAPPHQELAAQLLNSINDEQRARWKEANFEELLSDLESALRQVQSSESVETAAATMKAIAPRLIKHQNTLGTLLSKSQRELALQLLDLPGIFE